MAKLIEGMFSAGALQQATLAGWHAAHGNHREAEICVAAAKREYEKEAKAHKDAGEQQVTAQATTFLREFKNRYFEAPPEAQGKSELVEVELGPPVKATKLTIDRILPFALYRSALPSEGEELLSVNMEGVAEIPDNIEGLREIIYHFIKAHLFKHFPELAEKLRLVWKEGKSNG